MAAAMPLPPLPPQLKPIQHYLRTAQELDKRQPVVAYYCRLYAMQTGMKVESKDPECRMFLYKLMDQLEALKKELGDNEAITQEIVGAAYVEDYALRLFLIADNEDRNGRFHKNMIKTFFTTSLLFDVMDVFGELTDVNIQHRKYCRWKATYIHNCLKNGETPQSGPVGDEYKQDVKADSFPIHEEAESPAVPDQEAQPSPSKYEAGNVPASNFSVVYIPPGAHAPANTPAEVPHSTGATSNTVQPTPQSIPMVDPSLYNVQAAGEIHLTPEDFARAQKYCKYAGSALQYEDVNTAVQNLQKALKLLSTGRE